MSASQETIDAYKVWAEANHNATDETKLDVFRLYDNYTMSEDEAREALEDLETTPQLDLQLEYKVASDSQADLSPRRGK